MIRFHGNGLHVRDSIPEALARWIWHECSLVMTPDHRQEIWDRLIRRLSTGNHHGDVFKFALRYAARISRRLRIDEDRQRTRCQRANRILAEIVAGVASPEPFVIVAERERRDHVRRAMSQLPSDERRVIEAQFYQGLSRRVIAADVLHIGTSRSALQHVSYLSALGRRRLRAMLVDERDIEAPFRNEHR